MGGRANIIEIQDLSLAELSIYTDLNEPQLLHYYEPNGGLFIAESAAVIERALDAGCEPVSLLLEKRMVEGQEKLLSRVGEVPAYVGELALLRKLTGYTVTRGMLCAMRRPKRKSLEELCADHSLRRVTLLEDITNPTNVGAIFRSAAAMGLDAVLLTRRCSDPLYRRAIRVSMGTVFQIPWAYVDEDYMLKLSDLSFRTAAMALLPDARPIDDPRLKSEEKLAILLGTESTGLLPETIAKCDYIVQIPMCHGVDSLNVAAASAVAFWELAGRGED